MALLEWSSKYSVNVAAIDQQHQKLFGLINTLYDSMQGGDDKAVLGKVLGELAAYTVSHFAFEEKLFDQHGYPDTTAHKAEHKKLVDQVVDLQGKFQRGEAEINLDVMDFLQDWLNQHIMGVDKKYTSFMNGKGVV